MRACVIQKEPKLARARQIPEWEEYDAEIARFAQNLAKEGRIRSSIIAADANVLADAGAPTSITSGDSEEGNELQANEESAILRDEL